ncbi:MAG TPA: autotransporter-associated beta strand repeat-containing protein, partial [Candidatus Binatia bacterium]|nr:autotransporter-associated beta strand repeat-containing protein [Candidatus Binatia bacterium]
SLGAVNVTNDGVLIFDRSDGAIMSGAISGTGSVVQTGAGILTLAGANSYSGNTTIQNGTLLAASSSALGSTAGNTVITNGGTLDLNGNNLSAEPVLVSGWGVNSNGAVINSGAAQLHALANVTLTGDTAFGGYGNWLASGNPGRWDIRGSGTTLSTDGHPWNLYKVGSNQVSIVGADVDTNLANIDVQQGMLGFEAGSTSMGNPADDLIVRTGATLEFYQGSASANSYTKQFILYGGGDTPCITNWSGGGSSTLSGLMILNGPCVIGVNGTSFTNNCAIIGGGSLIKGGAKPLVLGGQNNYTGNTTVSGGTMLLQGNGSILHSAVITVAAGAALDASGRSDTKLTLAGRQTLTGNGAVSGIVQVGAGATLAPGTGIGMLTFSTNLVLSSGSTTVMEINKTVSPSNDLAQVAGDVSYGGTLVITNVGAVSFAAGDSFKLFNAAEYSGAFTNIVPAIPGINLAWDTNALANGVLSVVSSPTPPPKFGGMNFTGGNLIFSGGNGVPDWPYYVLISTNLNAPMTNWTIVATNAFDSEGKFIFINSGGTDVPQMFYRLKLP